MTMMTASIVKMMLHSLLQLRTLFTHLNSNDNDGDDDNDNDYSINGKHDAQLVGAQTLGCSCHMQRAIPGKTRTWSRRTQERSVL